MEYANENLDKCPKVFGVEVLYDEFGQEVERNDPELIFAQCSEAEEEAAPTEESLDSKLEALDRWDIDFADPDEDSETHDEATENPNYDEEDVEDDVEDDSEDDVKDSTTVDDDYSFFDGLQVSDKNEADPFNIDFSDISADEEEYQEKVDSALDPTEFLNYLAKELGIEGDVIIVPEEDADIPKADPIDVVEFTDDYEYPAVENCYDRSFDCDFADFDSDAYANSGCFTTDCCDEKEAEHVSKCHVCPNCGKEICECGNKDHLEEASSAEKKAYRNGGQDYDDYIDGKAIARIKDPKARDAAIAAKQAGREDVVDQFTGERKDTQAVTAFNKKQVSMQKAGVTEDYEEEEMSDLELAERLEAAKKAKAESLEGTVPQDLSDDRTPVSENSAELAAPTDSNEIRKHEKAISEFYDHEDHTIENEQELYGTDNAVVDCKTYDVVAHCEDEKPVDCKMEKEPLEKPLAEDYGEDYSASFEKAFNEGTDEKLNQLIDRLGFDYNNFDESEKQDLYQVYSGIISEEDYLLHRKWNQEHKDFEDETLEKPLAEK